MCFGKKPQAPEAPAAPAWSDPRQNDPKYLAIANKNGIASIDNPTTLYQVEQTIRDTEQAAYNTRMAEMEAQASTRRTEDLARADRQFAASQALQERQFAASVAAQERSLQMQIAAQAEMQRKAEEAALRSQVPEMTSNLKDARRIKAKSSSKQQARQASMGTSQLRIPLSIGSVASNSPVKLNIGS